MVCSCCVRFRSRLSKTFCTLSNKTGGPPVVSIALTNRLWYFVSRSTASVGAAGCSTGSFVGTPSKRGLSFAVAPSIRSFVAVQVRSKRLLYAAYAVPFSTVSFVVRARANRGLRLSNHFVVSGDVWHWAFHVSDIAGMRRSVVWLLSEPGLSPCLHSSATRQ